MKKQIIVVLCALLSFPCFAQDMKVKKVEVPADVKTAFSKDYPSIAKVEWEIEEGDYEAEFKQDGVETSAVYDKTGHRKEVEKEVKKEDVPAAAREYVAKHYPGAEMKEFAKITSDKNMVTYEIEIKLSGTETDLLFDASGNFLSEEKEVGDPDDDDEKEEKKK